MVFLALTIKMISLAALFQVKKVVLFVNNPDNLVYRSKETVEVKHVADI
jgi:hypothetical protein